MDGWMRSKKETKRARALLEAKISRKKKKTNQKFQIEK
jgi:hypothetical protein